MQYREDTKLTQF